MERQYNAGLPVAAIALFLGARLAVAGVVYEIEVTDHDASPPDVSETEISAEGRNLKMGIASKGASNEDMIFRGDRREMVMVNHKDKSYAIIDEAAMKDLSGKVADFQSESSRMMAEALKNVPEDKRAMVEQMMKQRMPDAQIPASHSTSKQEVKKTSDRATKNGYPAVKYEVHVDGRKTQELWVTDWDNIEGGREVIDTFSDMADFVGQLSASAGGRMDDNAFMHMKEIGGFPVLTREFGDDGKLEGETSLRSAKRRSIDPDAFEPPSGYKRQEMFGPGQ